MTYLSRAQATFGEPAEPRLFNRIVLTESGARFSFGLDGERGAAYGRFWSADEYDTPDAAHEAATLAMAEMNRAARVMEARS